MLSQDSGSDKAGARIAPASPARCPSPSKKKSCWMGKPSASAGRPRRGCRGATVVSREACRGCNSRVGEYGVA